MAPSPEFLLPQAALSSDATSIPILYPLRNGYWWAETHLTVAVRSIPNGDPALVAATRQAITTWNDFLVTEFGGLITLTDVTDAPSFDGLANITLHYVPNAGGARFAGYSLCAYASCPNVLVGSQFANLPPLSPRNCAPYCAA